MSFTLETSQGNSIDPPAAALQTLAFELATQLLLYRIGLPAARMPEAGTHAWPVTGEGRWADARTLGVIRQ